MYGYSLFIILPETHNPGGADHVAAVYPVGEQLLVRFRADDTDGLVAFG